MIFSSVNIRVETLSIQDQYPVFKNALTAEDVAITKERGSSKSEEIAIMDRLRDQTWRAIITGVDAALICPIDIQVKAAGAIKRVLDLYGDKRKADYPAESAVISNLVTDLLSVTNINHLDTLHITDWVKALKDENDEFRELFGDRNTELSAREAGDVRSARFRVDPALEEIVEKINATIVLGLAKPEVANFANEYNQLLTYYKNLIAIREAHNSKDEDTDTQKK